jgi:hypothetical protein
MIQCIYYKDMETIHTYVFSYFIRMVWLITGLVFLISVPLNAEIVYLRNSKTIDGIIVGQDKNSVRLLTKTQVMMVSKSEIRRIKYVPLTQAEKEAKKIAEKKIAEERAAKRLKLEKELAAQKAQAERVRKEKEIQALEEQIRQDQLKAAKERADRAAALRELVQSEKMDKPEGEPISYMDFAWRSALLPGWGHFYLDKPAFGIFYSAGTAALVVNAYQNYKVASQVKKDNERDVALNNLLSIFPVGDPALRYAYAAESNRKFLYESQAKVDRYNYSLLLLGAFYGINVLHIIYNGFAWENGLLIVKNDDDNAITVNAVVLPAPDSSGKRYSAAEGQLRIDYRF